MERCSRGPDPYRLLTPRFLLLSFVLRLHCWAVVENAAARDEAKCEPIRDKQPTDGRKALELAIL